MKHKEKIEEIIFQVVWEYHNGTSVCKGCGIYKWNEEPHEENCAYGELLKIIEEAKG